MAKQIFLHIGCPKTATTHIQRLLAKSRKTLLEIGYLYPEIPHNCVDQNSAFETINTRNMRKTSDWEALVNKIKDYSGNIILSSEILAAYPAKKIETIFQWLDFCPINLIVSLKPFINQISSEWQESILHGNTLEFDTWCEQVVQSQENKFGHYLLESQDPERIITRWQKYGQPTSVSVVTVPDKKISRPQELERRFLEAVKLDPANLLSLWREIKVFSNPRLNWEKAEVVRLANCIFAKQHDIPIKADGLLPLWTTHGFLRAEYLNIIKNKLGNNLLKNTPEHDRPFPIGLRDDYFQWGKSMTKKAALWIDKNQFPLFGNFSDIDWREDLAFAREFEPPADRDIAITATHSLLWSLKEPENIEDA